MLALTVLAGLFVKATGTFGGILLIMVFFVVCFLNFNND